MEQEVKRWRGRVGDLLFLQRASGSGYPEQEQHWPHVMAQAEQGGATGAPGGEAGHSGQCDWMPFLGEGAARLPVCLTHTQVYERGKIGHFGTSVKRNIPGNPRSPQ